MKKRIKWFSTSVAPDEHGNWISGEARFKITPRFRRITAHPDCYEIRDEMDGSVTHFDRVHDCKNWAELRVALDVAMAEAESITDQTNRQEVTK